MSPSIARVITAPTGGIVDDIESEDDAWRGYEAEDTIPSLADRRARRAAVLPLAAVAGMRGAA
ncbi:hypothetical protein [Streptomyces platensis]|uniref:hypothetical protein n=1 Tax=Streptomyces platensis TaxID=58346 RepID=UPI002F91AEA7|nr:hypothetical protein OG962_37370 [Streptomyces platensis]